MAAAQGPGGPPLIFDTQLDIKAAAADLTPTADAPDGLLYVFGNNLGFQLGTIELNALPLQSVYWDDQKVVARLPQGVTPGATYSLLVTRGPLAVEQDTFSISIMPGPSSSALSLVNANGGLIGPVVDVDTDFPNYRYVHVVVTIGSVTGVARAGALEWKALAGEQALYLTSDCSGVVYTPSAANPPKLLPTVVVVGAAGAEVLHVADPTATTQMRTFLSYRNPGQGCQPISNFTSDSVPLLPTTLDTTTLGPRPYRVVRTP